MRQEVDSAVLEPQMPQKCLHDAGLLKYGIVMWSLRKGKPRDTGWSHGYSSLCWPHPPAIPTPTPDTSPHRCCLPVYHWSQNLRNQGQLLDETSGSGLPKSTRKEDGLDFLLMPFPSRPIAQELHPYLSSTDFSKEENHESPQAVQIILLENTLFLVIKLYQGRNSSILNLAVILSRLPKSFFYSLLVNEKQLDV